MSTTIKPLDIYIGGTKVFPDVNTGILAYPIYNDMYEDSQNINSIHIPFWDSTINYFNSHPFNCPESLVMPLIEDTDASPWHTNSTPRDNYWNFQASWIYPIISIPFNINQNWIADAFTKNEQFANMKATVLNFDPNTSMPNTVGYDRNDHSVKTVDILNCKRMFKDCKTLKEIHGLNLGGTRDHLISYQSDTWCYAEQKQEDSYVSLSELKSTFSEMFWECQKLTTLDITWPEALSGTNYPVLYGNVDHMFFGCAKLTDAQIPTFALRPINQGETIKMQQLFGGANNRSSISSLHITDDSWPYIESARSAWGRAQIQSIDIPATATNLSYIKEILGEDLYTPTSGDYSGNKYIIRTEKPMTDYLNDNDDEHVKLFNFDNYDGDSDFLSTFGGIYVPDSQVTAWQTAIGTDFGAPNIAQNHVHGLSDL